MGRLQYRAPETFEPQNSLPATVKTTSFCLLLTTTKGRFWPRLCKNVFECDRCAEPD